jgi:hypothetical protein
VGAAQVKADLGERVNDWLDQPNQMARPPLSLWTELTATEKKAVDDRLAQNAVGLDGESPEEVPGDDIAQATPPGGPRVFRVPIPRQSGKEGAKNVPSWARGTRPYVDETPVEAATRTMDEQYGKGKWNSPDQRHEFEQLKKNYSRQFQDPKEAPAPYEGPYGLPGAEREV